MTNTFNMCRNCGGSNVSFQVVNEQQLKRKRRHIISWVLIWWWLEPILWVFFFIPRFFAALFRGKKQKIVNKTRKMAVCQSCGSDWIIN